MKQVNETPAGRDVRVTLFATTLSLFLMVALLVGTAVAFANYFQTRRVAVKLAGDTFQATINRINEQRVAFFAPAFLLATVLRNSPSLQSPAGSKEAIRQLVLTTLKANPQISAAYVGYDNGNFFHWLSIGESEEAFVSHLGAPPETRFAIQEIRADDAGDRLQAWYFLDAEARPIGSSTERSPVYDPRSRGWYHEAMERPQAIIRTLPYLFTATSQAGMTLAQALGHGGVVGVDITLDRLMIYIRSIRANDAHRFLAFDDKNHLLAHFNPRMLFKRTDGREGSTSELATTSDVTDPVVKEALRIFTEKGVYTLADFEVAGVTYLATVGRQVAKDGDQFFQLYAAPLSDFQGSLADAGWRGISVALLVFLLTLPAIIYLARSISQPLVKLSNEAQLIRSFELRDPIRLQSRVHEVNTLIRSMSGMKSTIREVSKFVPKALVRDILQSETRVAVGGETRRISILFTDVKDFTPIAERMSPDALMTQMSEYFEELASLVIKSDGTVDKFIGDAMFAFWNAPLPLAGHEHLACMAALECCRASRRLNARWADDGLSPWHTRLGIHVGEAVVGNVGSSDRIDYTAVGDNVNIASRLEGLNKFYGTSILASGQVAKVCSDKFLFRLVDRCRPKGVRMQVDLYELLGAIDGPEEFRVTAAATKLVNDWDDVYALYAERDWLRAIDAIEKFGEAYPDDKLAKIYLERIAGFALQPPAADWDGITRFDTK